MGGLGVAAFAIIAGVPMFEDNRRIEVFPFGQDVICASVSASVQLTANLLTEIYQLPAEIAVEENCISISVDAIQDVNAELLLQGLLLQMQLLTEEALGCIQIRNASAS